MSPRTGGEDVIVDSSCRRGRDRRVLRCGCGAGVSLEADAHRRAVCRRRPDRHRDAADRGQADRDHGPAGGGGKPRWRERPDRRGFRREIGARRLHDGHDDRQPGCDQSGGLSQDAVRHAAGPCAGDAGDDHAGAARRPSVASGEVDEGARVAGEGKAGAVEHCFDRQRQPAAPRDGVAESRGEGRPDPRSLQRRGAGGDGAGGRAGPRHVRRPTGAAAVRAERTAARARYGEPEARELAAGSADDDRAGPAQRGRGQLVRRAGAGCHPARDYQPPPRKLPEGGIRPCAAREARGARRGSRRQHTRAVHRLPEGRHRALGQARAEHNHQSRLGRRCVNLEPGTLNLEPGTKPGSPFPHPSSLESYSSSSNGLSKVSRWWMRMPYARAPASIAWRVLAGRASGGWTPGNPRGKCFTNSAARWAVAHAIGEVYTSRRRVWCSVGKARVPADHRVPFAFLAVRHHGGGESRMVQRAARDQSGHLARGRRLRKALCSRAVRLPQLALAVRGGAGARNRYRRS